MSSGTIDNTKFYSRLCLQSGFYVDSRFYRTNGHFPSAECCLTMPRRGYSNLVIDMRFKRFFLQSYCHISFIEFGCSVLDICCRLHEYYLVFYVVPGET
jgi:hypothetical protein